MSARLPATVDSRPFLTPPSAALLACVVFALPALALAQVPSTCDMPRDLDKYQLLRRLSLDLRGNVPTYEEYEALESQQSVPASTIQSYIASDGFRQSMRRYHEELFWPNVTNISINNTNSQLRMNTDEPAWSITSSGRRTTFRGDPDVNTTTYGKQCGDYEQTHFLDGGTYQPDPAFIYTEVTDAGKTVRQEGWRWVQPYWDDAGTPIKVCAYDAQETPAAPVTVGTTTVTYGCDYYGANGKKECGCGPNLTYCYGNNTQRTILTSLREQLNLAVDDVTARGAPYTDLLLSTKSYENGPIALWRKSLSNNLSLSRTYATADPQEEFADKPFTDFTFSEVNRGKQLDGTRFHAGVTTLPAYLIKFMTDRSRANRFRMDFMCEEFIPPATLTAEAGCKEGTTELTQRCYCQGCHKTLEPLAAHWGQFAEAGTTMLVDPVLFPKKRANCVGSGNSFCTRFFITIPGSDNAGALIPYQYADKTSTDPYRKAIGENIEAGPRKLAQQIINDGTFARCATKKLFRYLVKRDMHVAGAESEETVLLEQLASGFEASGYQFPWLVEQIVSLPQYRRIR